MNSSSNRSISTASGGSMKRDRKIIKIIVLGAANVGKTSIMKRYTRDEFDPVRVPTINSDFMSKKIVIQDTDVIVQIWDTAGQERFNNNNLGQHFYRDADGALIVYDCTDPESFEQIYQWENECTNRSGNGEYFPIVIVANKIDIQEASSEKVDNSEIIQWCKSKTYGHINTSAKDNLGIEAAMMGIIGLALEAKKSQVNLSANRNISTVNLGDEYKPKPKGCCS